MDLSVLNVPKNKVFFKLRPGLLREKGFRHNFFLQKKLGSELYRLISKMWELPQIMVLRTILKL
ncbi:conserved hypothetical protein [Leptospira interrogans serovar Copenhageni str. Fiocruz L1-130]|uniref:Uncharacterized protein n=1 Tax=Leptospira interrogans serogroup Icterohaemorrhagiae serovar copenhageni (strain Fiocruz L1-130) TaxID=267671 RepID=Q72LU1_LEPIC|nr:conserved hypothetical protein [Leptospira interrogans serovar Copenhageni str. Fiocruz L1-130]